MELDEFKTHWNRIQDKQFLQQKISAEKLEQIIMDITHTLGDLQAKSLYWKKMSKSTVQMLIGVQVIFLLITLIKAIYQHGFTGALSSLAFMFIIGVFSVVTVWIYKKQEQIFTLYNSDNVRVTLTQTIAAFKKFYLMFNIIYLFLYPAYFYAVIKLFIPYWQPSLQTLLLTCALATALSLIGGHWYYRIKFFKKLESLEANLKNLES